MVSVCRRAVFVLPGMSKAMPSRMPETTADKAANRMMTSGGAPNPTKQIQQGPVHCPSCGVSHRAGTACSKGLGDILGNLLKGVTRSGNKRGNPYHDDSTGKFTSASGGAGAAPGATANTEPPMGGIGTARTLQAPAASPAPNVTGSGTIAGKVNARPAQPGGTVAGKVNAAPKPAAETPSPAGAPTEKQDFPAGAGGGPFSHDEANAAYHQKRLEAVQGGANEQAAHQQGMDAGARAYANAKRGLEGQQPLSEAEFASARQRPAEHVAPPGPAAQPVAQAPAASAMPMQTQSAAPSAQQAQPARPQSPGTPTRAGSRGHGVLEAVAKPWASAAGSMGAGLFTPGATAAATGSALGGSAHGLLTHDPNAQQKTAAQQYQQRAQSAQRQSGHMQAQNQQYLNRLRGFLGQGGAR